MKIIDNQKQQMKDELAKLFPKSKTVDIASAFFMSSGYNLLKTEIATMFSNQGQIRLLMGTKTDKETLNELSKGHKEKLNAIGQHPKGIDDFFDSSRIPIAASSVKENLKALSFELRMPFKDFLNTFMGAIAAQVPVTPNIPLSVLQGTSTEALEGQINTTTGFTQKFIDLPAGTLPGPYDFGPDVPDTSHFFRLELGPMVDVVGFEIVSQETYHPTLRALTV